METVALQLAIRALDLQGDILTTPFSWIATCSSIMWEYCNPVFVDVDATTYNMDPSLIEDQITDRTVGIMAVHTFGNPCDVHAIDEVAKRRNLKVIYDGAHALGTKVDGKSVFYHGDVTATSFHATKLFQTGEGGGCTAIDQDVFERLQRLRFFGHDDQKRIVETGCNGKMTEIHAAMGLAVLKYFGDILASRKWIAQRYREQLSRLDALQFQEIRDGESNYSYMPVVFDSEETLLRVVERLNEHNIFPRRYFYPSLNQIKLMSGQRCPVSEHLAPRIICLPSYMGLDDSTIEQISEIVVQTAGRVGSVS